MFISISKPISQCIARDGHNPPALPIRRGLGGATGTGRFWRPGVEDEVRAHREEKGPTAALSAPGRTEDADGRFEPRLMADERERRLPVVAFGRVRRVGIRDLVIKSTGVESRRKHKPSAAI